MPLAMASWSHDRRLLLTLESYGVQLQLSIPSQPLRPEVERILPPGWKACKPKPGLARFSLEQTAGGKFSVAWLGTSLIEGVDLELALDVLDSQVRLYIAANAKPWLFVHAGAVVVHGRAIVIPGPSFSGKSTLVLELVKAGAKYGSDEFAILDSKGWVHPYPRRLSIRDVHDGRAREIAAAELGGVEANGYAPIGIIALTSYRPGAEWRPARVSPAAGMLGLLENTVPARDRPAEAMATTRRAIAGAVVLQGARGDAARAARGLLEAAEEAEAG